MENNKISLMDAYMIETLRSSGISNEEMVVLLEKKDISDLKRINKKFDFNNLLNLYEQDKDTFKSVLQDGYTVKFLTMNGLKNLLQMKFDKVAEKDYEISETGIHRLEIETQKFPALQQLLSINWLIEEQTDTNIDPSIKIVNIQIV
ncbi:hypothetical protein [Psychrobacillus lasiicapitis]|uniref:Uncharacterized protein n=1 Tax=Psychrobacillus lasiicapitis TaxID=1636719 RepID=A0A544SWX6_9BACI|nr:hypothetical protein [Psychrobacillus lasiicapitis]TQR09712.1 hypothetical protein FG382_18375 [Psychrobacillus lasiicapitis]GGA22918.1 hypothetical protein GCM10011384_10610 [Psychrobacillus lasiicapitis]